MAGERDGRGRATDATRVLRLKVISIIFGKSISAACELSDASAGNGILFYLFMPKLLIKVD